MSVGPIAKVDSQDGAPSDSVSIHDKVGNFLKAAEDLRRDLKSLASKDDDECADILLKLEGPEWINIGRSKDGHVVFYRDLKEHNGKLVRIRLRELLESSIKSLEEIAQSIVEGSRQSR